MDKTPDLKGSASCDPHDFVGYTMTLRMVYWLEDVPNYFSFRHAANVAVKRAIEEAGVRLVSPITRA